MWLGGQDSNLQAGVFVHVTRVFTNFTTSQWKRPKSVAGRNRTCWVDLNSHRRSHT